MRTGVGTAAVAVVVLVVAAAGGVGPATAQSEPRLVVQDATVDGPVRAGDPLTVRATVENVGASGAATLRLAADDRVDSRRVRLSSGRRTTVTLTWATTPRDAGRHDLRLRGAGEGVVLRTTVADELVAGCTVFDEGGVYALTAGATDADTEACLELRADGVTVDGRGHLLDGGGDGGGVGVLVRSSAADARVVAVRTRGWGTGVAARSEGVVLDDVTAARNAGSGVEVSVPGARLEGVRASSNRRGIVVRGADATVTGAVVTGNTESGVTFADAGGSLLRDARADGNGDGVAVTATDGLRLRNVTVTASRDDGVTTSPARSRLSLDGVRLDDSGGVAVDGDAAVVRAEAVRVDGARLSFVADRARVAATRGEYDVPSDELVTVGAGVRVEPGGPPVEVTLSHGPAADGRIRDGSLGAWRFDGQWTRLDGRADGRAVSTTVGSPGVVVLAGGRNRPPDPTLRVGPGEVVLGEPVTVDATGSRDPDRRGLAAFAWDLDGDGRFERRTERGRVRHVFDVAGAATVRVRVTDADGASRTARSRVTVLASTDAAPDDDRRRTTVPPRVGDDRTPAATVTGGATPGSSRGVVDDRAGVVAVVVVLVAVVAVAVRGRT